MEWNGLTKPSRIFWVIFCKTWPFPKERTLLHRNFLSARGGKHWEISYENVSVATWPSFDKKGVAEPIAYSTGVAKESLLTCSTFSGCRWPHSAGRRGFRQESAAGWVQVLSDVVVQEVFVELVWFRVIQPPGLHQPSLSLCCDASIFTQVPSAPSSAREEGVGAVQCV